jgi:hypothetical protein
MWCLLVAVPFVLLGLCAVAAAIAGGRADRMMEQWDSTVHQLPALPTEEEPAIRLSG